MAKKRDKAVGRFKTMQEALKYAREDSYVGICGGG